MANETPLLDARDVTIRFGGLTAVSHFNLAIQQHELVGLIGPNGAGKTTVFNMLTGVYKPTEGEIFVDGHSTRDLKPYQITTLGVVADNPAGRGGNPDKRPATGLARTFQNIRLFKELSVLDNVKIGGHTHYRYSAISALLKTNSFQQAEQEAESHAMELLGIFGLQNRADAYARNLPYGDQRRLEIARALASGPKLLLLDEPAAGLNDRETHDLMDTIHDIRDRFKIAILVIEHNMELVMGICERIIVLSFGKTIAQGTPEAIRENPVVIEAYLGEPAEVAGI